MPKKQNVALIMNIPASHTFGFEIPISLLYLAPGLIAKGHKVAVLDRRVFPRKEELLASIRDFQPDIVGLPLFASDYSANYGLVNSIKRYLPDAKFVMGGPEVTAARDFVMTSFLGKVDYLLAGESEYTLPQLADALAENDPAAIESIEGLSYQKDGVIHHNPAPAPIRDIDSIPFPQRDLLSPDSWKHYYRPGLGRPTDMMFTSRGCPFSCNFCFRLTKGYRARSPQNVLAEMEEIYARGVRGLIIEDDNFTIDRKRCIAILEGILSRGWRFNLKCRGRVGNVDPELLKLMKRAGVRSLTFGIESGSQEVLDAMGKKTTVEQNYRAVEMVRKSGLQCYADMFLGYPGETLESIKETSEFLRKAKPTGIDFGYLYPLHATTVYDEAKKNGNLVGDWGLLEEYPWVKLPWFSDIGELQAQWREVSRKYWLNPGTMARGIAANLAHFTPKDYVDVAKALWHRYTE